MAAATVNAKLIVVDIVRAMAVTTTTVDGLHFAERASMTVIAGDIDMRTAQFEFSLNIVVKDPKIPGDRIVASVTAPGEVFTMRIVVFVASGTAFVHDSEYLGLVTILAFVLVVNAEQRKGSEVMVEENRVLPGHFRVAAFAQSAERTFVSVIFGVAGFAACSQSDIKNRFDMTIATGCVLVCPDELVVGIQVVIELRLRPRVVAVAGIASLTIMCIVLIIFQMAGYTSHIHFILKWFF